MIFSKSLILSVTVFFPVGIIPVPSKCISKERVEGLVWFARIIEWEFSGFSVDGCLGNLYYAQELLDRNGAVEAKTHRFMMVAKKEEKRK